MKIDSEYQKGKSIRDLMKEFKSGYYTIRKQISKTRTISEAVRKHDSRMLADIIQQYGNGIGTLAIANKYNLARSTILRLLKENNVIIRPDIHVKYECNNHYFDKLDSSNKLYWFGFLLADGYLGRNGIVINLGMCDIKHLELFKNDVGYTGPIRQIKSWNKKYNKEYISASLQINRRTLIRGLRFHGFDKIRDDNVQSLKNFSHNDIRTILLGFFDGDGSIYLDKRNRLRWYICGPNKNILEYFMSRCPVVKRHNSYGKPRAYRVGYSGKVALPVCEWLYSGATRFLQRKKQIYDKLGDEQ